MLICNFFAKWTVVIIKPEPLQQAYGAKYLNDFSSAAAAARAKLFIKEESNQNFRKKWRARSRNGHYMIPTSRI